MTLMVYIMYFFVSFGVGQTTCSSSVRASLINVNIKVIKREYGFIRDSAGNYIKKAKRVKAF